MTTTKKTTKSTATKKSPARKKNKNKDSDEKFLQYCFGWWLIPILEIIFKVLVFIFWSNKYLRSYREKKKERKKQHRRLMSKARKEIMLSTIAPLLQEHGFHKFPGDPNGWERQLQQYYYRFGRIRGEELQLLNILFDSEVGYQFNPYRFILTPLFNEISELSWNMSLTIFAAVDFKLQPHIYLFPLRPFKNEKDLNKQVILLKQKITEDFSNFDEMFAEWTKNLTPTKVDLSQEIKAIGEMSPRNDASESP